MSPLRIAVALVIVSSILFGTHYYLWARLVRDTALPPPWGTIATGILIGLGALVIVAMMLRRASRTAAEPVMWVAYTWLGMMFLLFVLLVGADALRALVGVASRLASAPPPDADRRLAVARVLAGFVGAASVVLGAVSVRNALRAVAVKRVKIELKKLPASASGYRIALLSDVHVGPTIGKGFIEDIVRRVNALEPDLVAIAGDLIDGRVAALGPLVAPLAGLRAKDGVFFITGNHEYYSGVDEWLAFLPTLGIKVLVNERVPIRGAEGFDLAGVEDLSAKGFEGHGADLPRALSGRDDTRALVLLAHQPKAIVEAEALGVDLQLSGHTHGGQIFPWNYAVALDQPYVAGLHDHGNAKIYVSCGTGYWGPPMRLGAPAEITEIELRAG